jgi:hypothetical protein
MKRILRKLSIVNYPLSIVLLLAAIMTLSACPAEGIDPDPVDPEDPELPVDPVDPVNPGETVQYVMQSAALTGSVTDAGGAPLSGVKVTTGTASATTGSDGMYTLDKAGTFNGRTVVKFEKSGYFAVTRSGTKKDNMRIDAKMSPKGNSANSLQTTFASSEAKTIGAGGVKIELPANAFATADGSPYTGTVHADILYIGPLDGTTFSMMPGGDLATAKNGETIDPYGIADITFTDDTGLPLKLKNGATVPLTFASPEDADAASVPFWMFDEVHGLWKEEGSATRHGNAYTATVSHLSLWGPAPPFIDEAIVRVNVTECDGKPAAGAKVTFKDEWWNDMDALRPLLRDFPNGDYYTNSSGILLMDMYCDIPLTVTVTYKGITKRVSFRTTRVKYKQIDVNFEFKEDCGDDGEIVFNLKPGPISKSFIIACNPAMPLSGTPANPVRMRPDMFLKDAGSVYSVGGFIFTKSDGDTPTEALYVQYEDSGWNEDFTEYTYVVNISFMGETKDSYWSGTIQLKEIFITQLYMIDGKFLSFKMGTNVPIPLMIKSTLGD